MKRGTIVGGLRHEGVHFAVLSDSELAEIQRGTLEVLERTGVWVEDDEALSIYADGGCRVNRDTHIVKIPAHLVESAIATTPSTFRLCGRDPENDIILGGGRTHFMNFGIGLRVTDPVTGENRDSTKADCADACRLVDYASEMDMVLEPLVPHDRVTPAIHILDAELNNCMKPTISGPGSAAEAEACVAVAAAVAGGRDALRERPLLVMGGATVSPLRFTKDASDCWLVAARNGLPATALTMSMAGGSGPQTLAGTLVVDNAELLGAAVLIHLVSRGNPILFATSTLAMDLRYGAACVGTPEAALLTAGVAQLAEMHGIPLWASGL